MSDTSKLELGIGHFVPNTLSYLNYDTFVPNTLSYPIHFRTQYTFVPNTLSYSIHFQICVFINTKLCFYKNEIVFL